VEPRLLNPNQQRRVATHLRLLREDLDDLAGWPELARPGEPYETLRSLLARTAEVVARLARALALPAHQPPPLRRRVMATAEVWASAIEDVRSAQLKGYGTIHPRLAEVLDPGADEIARLLREMAAAANELPDR
jgi:hypothetical protein